MPLIKGKSEKSFVKNMKTEMEHGHPQKQSLAIAYAMKRKAQHKAKGGAVHGSGCTCSQCMEHMDDGGYVDPKAKKSFQDAFSTPQASPAPDADADRKAKYEAIRKQNSANFAHGGQIEDNYQPSGKPHVDKEFSHEPAEFASGYMMHEGNDVKSNGPAMSEEHKKLNQHAVDMMASTSMSEQDMVDRIMEKRSQDFSNLDRYAKGGEVDSMDKFMTRQANKPKVKGVHESIMKSDPGTSVAGSYHGSYGHNQETSKRLHREKYAESKSMPNPKLKGLSEGGKVANQEHGENNNELAGFSPNEFDDLVLRDDLESTYGDDDNSGDNLGNAQEDEDRHDIVARIMASRKKKDRMPNPA